MGGFPYNKLHKLLFLRSNILIIKRSAIDVAHNIYGAGTSQTKTHILILHGLLGSKRNWRSMSEKIASSNNATVIAADARNHGDSPHSDSHTYSDLAADAFQLLTKLSLKSVHVIGHSMGGRTAMVMALTEPSKVTTLLVNDISPMPKPNRVLTQFPEMIKVMRTVNFSGADTDMKAKAEAKKILESHGYDAAFLSFLIMNIGQLPDKTFGWKTNLQVLADQYHLMVQFPSEMASKKYEGPTLFIGGGSSDFIPKSDLPGIQGYFPKAQLTYIDNVGHNPHAENPAEFLKLYNQFLGANTFN